MGFGIKISETDRLFSLLVRGKANWTCERCFKSYDPPTTALHCSHFHTRGKKSVRWDLENAAALCFGCHLHFTGNPLEHVEWFKKRLGEVKFDALTLRANIPQRIDEKLIRMGLKAHLKKLDGHIFGKP